MPCAVWTAGAALKRTVVDACWPRPDMATCRDQISRPILCRTGCFFLYDEACTYRYSCVRVGRGSRQTTRPRFTSPAQRACTMHADDDEHQQTLPVCDPRP
jgi:hypothetical protein